MSALPFLLEIGCEEIPDWMIVPALENFKDLFEGLGVGPVTRVDATPRRLALWAGPLLERQPDKVEVQVGPFVSAGDGPAKGFAKKFGVAIDQLVQEEHEQGKGLRYKFSRPVPGRQTSEILAEKIPEIIGKIQWPKTMYWTIPGGPLKGGPRFIRPIRWIVALLGDQVVPFAYGDVKSGAITRGHRILGKTSIAVLIDSYEDELRKNFVIVSAAERKVRIVESIAGKDVKPDLKLLDTLTYITEYPTSIEGGFDPAFLKLPKEVLVMVMRHHQKYFSVEDGNGELAPKFIAIMNSSGDPEGLVQKGNESVLRARFNDARFFWNVDQQKKLADRVEDLKAVTFQAKIGSYFDKTKGIEDGAGRIAAELNLDKAIAGRAARLAKTDLVTDMVKEFTDLQGIVGGLYLHAQGEQKEVWEAVYEHYQPLNMDAPIPRNPYGQVISLADKLDTIEGCFAVGIIPTGSKDPLGLRRAAQGIVKILVEGSLRLNLGDLVKQGAVATDRLFQQKPSAEYAFAGAADGGEKLAAQILDFLAERVKYYFRDVRGFAYDEVNAVMAAGWNSLPDVEARLIRVSKIRPTADFEPLAASFKRMKNILTQANFTGGGAVDPALIEDGPERELHEEFKKVSGLPLEQAVVPLRPKLDLFFDKVLVNAPDETVRANRLKLLRQIIKEFSTIADFSEIVTSGDNK